MTDIVSEKKPQRTHSGRVLLSPPDGYTNRSGRREYECIFMQPGYVKRADQTQSDWLIPAAAIQAAEPLFNSVSSYLDHPGMFGFGWHQDHLVKNLVGVTFNAAWSDTEEAMMGGIRLYDQEPGSAGALVGALMDQMLTDKAAGLEVPPIGLSAVLFEDSELDEETGARVSTKFAHIESIDFVYDAGAGGYVRAALSAAGYDEPFRRVWNLTIGGTPPTTTHGGETMPEEATLTPGGREETPPPDPPALSADELYSLLQNAAVNLNAATAAQLAAVNPPAQAEPEPDPEPNPLEARLNTLTEAVERLTALQAEQESPITGMGQSGVLTPGRAGLEQVEAALQAMVDGVRPPDGIRPLTGIRELYHLLSGDYEMNGIFQEDRVYLANVTSSTMAQLVANVMNKRVMNQFQAYPQWWAPIVHPEDFATLQQVRWITLGGIGELPTVAEGAAYTELTWDDLAQRSTFAKKGGYLGLTLEAIDKDDTRKITAAPRALAQAAWLTLSKSISNIFTESSGVGPDIYYDDSNTRALFNASNSNLGSTALSWTAWDATRTAMRKQTELNSDERLGALTAPKYLLVPPDLETTALQILASEGEPGTGDNDENPFAEGDAHSARLRAARRKVIVVDLWTETADWAAVADPNLWATIGLAFRYGRTPEVFSVADPRAGLMFTNDTMPIKVRFFYATGPIDYRGLYKHNP